MALEANSAKWAAASDVNELKSMIIEMGSKLDALSASFSEAQQNTALQAGDGNSGLSDAPDLHRAQSRQRADLLQWPKRNDHREHHMANNPRTLGLHQRPLAMHRDGENSMAADHLAVYSPKNRRAPKTRTRSMDLTNTDCREQRNSFSMDIRDLNAKVNRVRTVANLKVVDEMEEELSIDGNGLLQTSKHTATLSRTATMPGLTKSPLSRTLSTRSLLRRSGSTFRLDEKLGSRTYGQAGKKDVIRETRTDIMAKEYQHDAADAGVLSAGEKLESPIQPTEGGSKFALAKTHPRFLSTASKQSSVSNIPASKAGASRKQSTKASRRPSQEGLTEVIPEEARVAVRDSRGLVKSLQALGEAVADSLADDRAYGITGANDLRRKQALSQLIATSKEFQSQTEGTALRHRNQYQSGVRRHSGLAGTTNTTTSIFLRVSRMCSDLVNYCAIEPRSKRLVGWKTVVLIVSLVYMIITPIWLAFGSDEEIDHIMDALMYLEPGFEAVLVLDIVVNFVTAVEWRGLLVRNKGFIARAYIGGWFLVDVIAVIPFGYQWNKLVRLAYYGKHFFSTTSNSQMDTFINPGILSLMKIGIALLLMWLFMACLFWGVATYEDSWDHQLLSGHQPLCTVEDQSSCWIPTLPYLREQAGVLEKFSHSYFFAVVITAGVGWDIIPKTQIQVWYTIVMVMLGLVVYALLVGSASNAMQTFNAEANAGHERTKKLDSYLRKHHVSFELQERLRAYLRYSWESSDAMEHEELLENLPSVLKVELAFEVKAAYLEIVPVFRLLERAVMQEVLQVVHRRVFVPSEVIIQEGTEGDTLYVLQKGSVAIEKAGRHLSVLTDGSYFGEQALLYGTTRSASALAISFCETMYLTRDDIQAVADDNPQLAAELQSARQRGSDDAEDSGDDEFNESDEDCRKSWGGKQHNMPFSTTFGGAAPKAADIEQSLEHQRRASTHTPGDATFIGLGAAKRASAHLIQSFRHKSNKVASSSSAHDEDADCVVQMGRRRASTEI